MDLYSALTILLLEYDPGRTRRISERAEMPGVVEADGTALVPLCGQQPLDEVMQKVETTGAL